MANEGRQKIAVLGGGIGSLTAAYELALSGKYDITVYQMGWRLGGQGASGRNQELNNRIEEHGLHIWFGFYKNAFNLMWRCYNSLGRPAGAPLATVQEAFVGEDSFTLLEHVDGACKPWSLTVPHNDLFPGIPPNNGELPTLWDLILLIMDALRGHFHQRVAQHVSQSASAEPSNVKPSWWEEVTSHIETAVELGVLFTNAALLDVAYSHAAAMDKDPQKHTDNERENLHWLIRVFHRWITLEIRALSAKTDDLRRDMILLDLGLAIVEGMIADDVCRLGLDSLNSLEYRQWLRKYNATEDTVNSAVVQALYDAAFAYVNGCPDTPNMAAGVALRSSLRIVMTFTGHILWKMNAGMGDAIFAPLYQALKNLGVKFEFFQRVTGLELSSDKKTISQIQMSRQVTLKNAEYSPLIDVKGLPCWPNQPLYDQIVEADRLKGINLESRWSGWKDVETFALESGKDFDLVVLGISIAALPEICGQLIAANDKWKTMIQSLKTVQTQQFQVWVNPTVTQTGWRSPGGITACSVEPEASWGDFSQVLPAEQSPSTTQSLFYGCGPLPDDTNGIPPPDDLAFPDRERQRARETALETLRGSANHLWPSIAGANGQIQWDELAAAPNQSGEQRFDAQYWRANIDPTDRYVLSVAGGEDARLKTDESGFANLYLAGTWIDNGLNISSVEAGVMSGMQASRAISGSPATIVGEKDI